MSDTYSFGDVNIVISHPQVGQKVINGEGIGNISFDMTTEKTVHDVAADGRIMVSKVPGINGTITIAIQQVSSLHHWLIGWYNHVLISPTSEWALAQLTLRSPVMGDSISAFGISPQKMATRPFQAQGQLVTWTLMSTAIHHDS